VINTSNFNEKIPLTYLNDNTKKQEVNSQVSELPALNTDIYLSKNTNTRRINLPALANQTTEYT